MSEDCPRCIHNDECHDKCRGCFEGSNYKPKPLTNADRIRAMTDEELAEWIDYSQGCFESQGKRCPKYGTCRDCWFDWLKQECE